MTNGEQPKDQPNAKGGESEDNTQYRWNDSEWRVPPYKHWEAGNSDYQADERRYWGHQVWAIWTNVGVGIATLTAACIAVYIAYSAYGETRTQTVIAAQGSRPYVLFDPVDPKFPSNLDTTNNRPTFEEFRVKFKFTNYGKTPAIIKSIDHHMLIPERKDEDVARKMLPQLFRSKNLPVGLILTAEGSTPEYSDYVPVPKQGVMDNARTQIMVGQKRIWLAGRIRYQSVQSYQFETGFCFFVDFPFGKLTEWNDPDCNYRK